MSLSKLRCTVGIIFWKPGEAPVDQDSQNDQSQYLCTCFHLVKFWKYVSWRVQIHDKREIVKDYSQYLHNWLPAVESWRIDGCECVLLKNRFVIKERAVRINSQTTKMWYNRKDKVLVNFHNSVRKQVKQIQIDWESTEKIRSMFIWNESKENTREPGCRACNNLAMK